MNVIEELSEFECFFKTAVKASYIKAMTKKQITKLSELYELILQRKLTNPNCNGCVYNMVLDLGLYYYNELNKNDKGQDTGNANSKSSGNKGRKTKKEQSK